MRVRMLFAVLLVPTLCLIQPRPFPPLQRAFAAETVHFPSAAEDHATITGYLTHPDGAGPFPAVVLISGCDGDMRPLDPHVTSFVSQEYAVLAVDTHGSRHAGNVCGNSEKLPELEQAKDAFGAHAYLRSLSYVDANRIAIVGWSMGGGVATYGSSKGLPKMSGVPDDGFRAAVAFYPPCGYLQKYAQNPRVPLLILIGESDDWTPADECKSAAQLSQQNGQPVTIQTFPGVGHAFDEQRYNNPVVYQGHHLAYNPSAAAAAETAMMSFLQENLK